jgi:molybdopterin synthase catalytic subunit
LAIRDAPLSVDEVLAPSLIRLRAGVCRSSDGSDPDAAKLVTGLEYSAHPTAIDQLRASLKRSPPTIRCVRPAAVHRVGDPAVGDLAVVVGAACPHRAEAFAACHGLIDELKVTVPIWKHSAVRRRHR